MKPRPPSSPMLSLSSSQGRSNPFRVGSPNKKASGKSFFDSVEEEKKSLLMNKNKISPESKAAQKKKKGKQTTLLKTPPGKENPATDDKTPTEKVQQLEKKFPSAKKVNGFNLWFEDNKEAITEDNSELSAADLVKFAMRKWKSLGEEEKVEWNKKAKDATSGTEQDDKKRKREKCDDENEDITSRLNQAKKAKEITVNGATSKLAGFAYKKD